MSYRYVGRELDLFHGAVHWKRYWASRVAPYVKGSVLEVGAGLGANTALLRQGSAQPWLCLEPDEALAARLRSRVEEDPSLDGCRVVASTTASLAGHGPFDTILYIDVLEHIEDDREELERAAALLGQGGTLVILAPAHPALTSEFDRAVGHFRRYTKRSLAAVVPELLTQRSLVYLDSVGLALSCANRLLLRQSLPTARQLRLWDRCLIPLSRFLDALSRRRAGKSVLGAWQA